MFDNKELAVLETVLIDRIADYGIEMLKLGDDANPDDFMKAYDIIGQAQLAFEAYVERAEELAYQRGADSIWNPTE